MNCSIGLVIPVYNTEKYLRECLESVIAQIIPFDEVIMINDGSCDGSQNICEEYSIKYPYMKLINQSNQGPSVARNKGMMHCKCDYIVFLDSDDYIVPQMVEVLKKRLNSQDMFCYAAQIQNDMEENKFPNVYIRSVEVCKSIMTGMEFLQYMFPHNYIVSPCLSVYKKTFLDEYCIHFPEGMYYEDDFFSVQLVCNARKIECIEDMLYVRRYRPGSTMTGSLNERKYVDKMRIQLKIWEYIRTNNNGWKKSFLKKFILYNISRILLMDKQCQTFSEGKTLEIDYWKKFMEYWENLYDIENLSFIESFLLMKAYEKQMNIEKEGYLSQYIRTKKRFEKERFRVLEGLCLNNKNKKIGIYGMGKHTVLMLALYEKIIKKIECQYIFIVSKLHRESVLMADGHFVVSCDNIPEDMDLIIISSLIYQKDMIENLKKTGIDLKKIYCLYTANEIYDLCTLEEIEPFI